MREAKHSCWTALLWWLLVPGARSTSGPNTTRDDPRQLICQPGHYCPEGGGTAVPCPAGTFGPGFWAVDVRDCIHCPLHHYAPREGLPACLPCGSKAQQPLPGQDKCVCLGEGQVFQASDGQCHCALGYRATQRGDGCELKVYEICRDGRIRNQHGECLDGRQWERYCSHQVCASPEQYDDYDTSLGLCVCSVPTEPAGGGCVGWCPDRPAPPLRVVCSAAVLRLFYTRSNSQVIASGNVLLSVLKRWDPQGRMKCDGRLGFSRPVYVVQVGEAGFLGFLHTIPVDVRMLVLESSQEIQSTAGAPSAHVMVDVEFRENHTHMDMSPHWSTGSASRGSKNGGVAGVLNPIACLHLGDILLFTVTRQHYPQYDVENLFNSNAAFDWGPFRMLAGELTMMQPAHSLFSISFSEPGVYALTLSSNPHKHMYVKVMPTGGECYDPGPFFPADPRHMTRMGIGRRRHLSLRPDWLAVGGLLAGTVALLCLCIVLLVLFRDYGWPEKLPAQARYRALQLKYNMDDYSSKGSRVMLLRKTHRNLQVEETEESRQKVFPSPGAGKTLKCEDSAVMPVMLEDFWDYEEQVDLEAFSSSTFYDILLKHSMSVTACLGQLRGEVKELYQTIIGKVQGLHPACGAVAWGKLEGLERQVEREMARRKALGRHLTRRLDSQLQTLRAEMQAQHVTHEAFATALRECEMLLQLGASRQGSLEEPRIQQSVKDRVTVLAGEMSELVTAEAQRQGAWVVLRQSTGARLLRPASRTPVARDDVVAPDGTVRACDAVHVDPCTGLIVPNCNAHMLLASGHSMPVPPDFFLHPQTGRVLPVAGNVGFDPISSTLVCTADACEGEVGKFESPLLPYVPYPPSRPGLSKLRALRSDQRLVFGGPMCDYDTGVPVPILAVTIHPQTGAVYPLGGVHVCPVSRLLLPIQIGCPMVDTRTGNVVLITGVTMDHHSGAVLPVGGPLLWEPFIEPLSGKQARVGGCSMRGGKVVPHAGGFQALLDCQALGARARLVERVRASYEGWSPGALEKSSKLRASTLEVDRAWRASQHCILQLLSQLEAQREWAWKVALDGGSVGEVKLPGTDLGLPALPGLEYPDPGGCGLSVPVLGAQFDWLSGCTVPLAGTMEDPEGKGLVPIRFGARTVDPVTGVLATVVGARLDVWKRTVVPVTLTQCLTVGETSDCVMVEALQEECSLRGRFWRDQGVREEELLADLERTLSSCLYPAGPEHVAHLAWTEIEKQLIEAVAVVQEAAQTEAQRRSCQTSDLLSLLMPPHVLLTLTRGDEEEMALQRRLHTELTAVLNRVRVFMAQWQWKQDQEGEVDANCSQGALWELVRQSLCNLGAALVPVRLARELSRIGADTAQAVLSGSFWYRDYGLIQASGRNPMKEIAMTQSKVLPRLERLVQLLEDGRLQGLSDGSQRLPSSDPSREQMLYQDTRSGTLAVSVPSVPPVPPAEESVKDQEKGSAMRGRNALQSPTERWTHVSPSDTHVTRDPILDHGGDWARLMELSPVFQLLKEVEQQLGEHAHKAGLLDEETSDSGRPFLDFLDAQWECEGHLVQVPVEALSPGELRNYQHGQLLLQLLHSHKVAPAVTLLLASSLPANDYHCNAFRNSFYYQETEGTLYVRCQRLQCVGGLSLLLLHCTAHISCGQLDLDSAPAFQRAFFKVLQVGLRKLELAHAVDEGGAPVPDSAPNDLALEREQRASGEKLPEDVSMD